MPPVSQAQRQFFRWAAEHPKESGISLSVSHEFNASDPGGKLPARAMRAIGGGVDFSYQPPTNDNKRFANSPLSSGDAGERHENEEPAFTVEGTYGGQANKTNELRATYRKDIPFARGGHMHHAFGGGIGHGDPLGNLAKPTPVHIAPVKGIGGGSGVGSGMGGSHQTPHMSGSQQSPWWTRSEARMSDAPAKFDDGGGVPMSEGSPWWERQDARISDVPFHGGLIGGSGAGRTDRLPLAVGAESHVIPADVVSALGQGATSHGGRILQGVLGGGVGPYDTKLPAEIHGHGPPRAPGLPRGAIEEKAGGTVKPVSILAASGEYVVEPERVRELGERAIEQGKAKKGETAMQAGHRLLDEMIARIRRYQIDWLKRAPPPKK